MNQIADRLNSAFAGEGRKLIFWYDDNAEFVDDIDSLALTNAKIWHLKSDNQFYTKYFFENIDKNGNYLVYAPFAKPAILENHLADTIRYSQEFFADRATLIMLDLGIDERFKPVLQNYANFFANKERTQKFYDLEIGQYNRSTIEIGLMGVLCKCKIPTFEDVLRSVLLEDWEDNNYLNKFNDYGLLPAFWQQLEIAFGYQDTNPTLQKLIISLFITSLAKTLRVDLPPNLQPFISYKSGSVVAFLDNLMNNVLYSERFDRLSQMVYKSINLEKILSKVPVEKLIECAIFEEIDSFIIQWMLERLLAEDTGAKLNGQTMPEVCRQRRRTHFGQLKKAEYFVLENAWYLLAIGKYNPFSSLNSIADYYVAEGFLNDRRYRYFYLYFDKIEDTAPFEHLRELIENIYTNEYLNRLMVNWNEYYAAEQVDCKLKRQQDFFNNFVRYAKERTVVIISDALRYEVACTLLEELQHDEKCRVNITPMLSVLPSYTQLGMAALLPHKTLELSEQNQVLLDSKTCEDLKSRQAILQTYRPNSCCVQYDDIKNLKVAELREIFTGQDVVYIYHNQIDARGDKLSTENEVFVACEEAVAEIHSLIRRLSTSANTVHFIVTADHGFVYKRDKLAESDKISNTANSGAIVAKRYIIDQQEVLLNGVASVPIKEILRNKDERIVSYPVASDIFKVAGSGQNFVHGGSSPQELIVPVLDIKTEKGHKETHLAQIALLGLVNKITNLITSLDFVQTEAVNDIVKETAYRLYFVDFNGNKISNESFYKADNQETETVKRIFRLRFSFKNQQYSRNQKYYIVAVDSTNDLEVWRQEIMIDIAWADDFGF